MPPRKKKNDEESLTADELLLKLQSEGLKIGLDIPEQQWYSTGNMAIDCVTGGGIPQGRIVTLAGPHASGKTTTAVSTAQGVIESGRRVLFCDAERTLDKPYFKSLGVDPDDTKTFVRFNPRTAEEAFNTIRKLTNTGEFGLTIVDSIPALITEKERTGDLSSGMNLELPKLLRAALKQANDYCFETESTLILLNHLLEKVDITPAGQQMAMKGIKQYTMPGGTGPYFYSSMILWFRKKGDIKADRFDPLLNEEISQKIGFHHTVTVAKNKVAKPDGVTDVVNILGEGFSNFRTAIEILKAHGIIKKNSSWYNFAYRDELAELVDKTQGEENFIDAVKANPQAKGLVVSRAHDLLKSQYDALESKPDTDAEDEQWNE